MGGVVAESAWGADRKKRRRRISRLLGWLVWIIVGGGFAWMMVELMTLGERPTRSKTRKSAAWGQGGRASDEIRERPKLPVPEFHDPDDPDAPQPTAAEALAMKQREVVRASLRELRNAYISAENFRRPVGGGKADPARVEEILSRAKERAVSELAGFPLEAVEVEEEFFARPLGMDAASRAFFREILENLAR